MCSTEVWPQHCRMNMKLGPNYSIWSLCEPWMVGITHTGCMEIYRDVYTSGMQAAVNQRGLIILD